MEKILMTFSFLASVVFSSSIFGETMTMDDLVERDKLYYKKFTNIPFTGDVFGIVSGKFKMGKKNGEWLYYYGNGQLRALYNYKDGILDGPYKKFRENGELEREGSHKNDKEHGTLIIHHKLGALISRINYRNGEKHGLSEIFHYMIRGENYGRLWQKSNYKEGKLNGLREEYNEDGSLRMTQTWKDDKLIKMNGKALQ